ncbi:hypothetical protein B4099_3713 [Heyndrickxia coagulans]|uniref:Uncharacterized protein n=1 Tax=Heyndrickxia coagulans TaxID=1398 RepID=A0A150KEM3_HEYCO|nr:hypothetical protein B4099_3713 [Heyndrickxia coagulans]
MKSEKQEKEIVEWTSLPIWGRGWKSGSHVNYFLLIVDSYTRV